MAMVLVTNNAQITDKQVRQLYVCQKDVIVMKQREEGLGGLLNKQEGKKVLGIAMKCTKVEDCF